MRFLRTNTAVRLTVGPFFDPTDGVTPEVALTVTNCKLTLMCDVANVPTLILDTNPTASGGANDMVHVTGDDAGFYDLELAAANLNYVGRAMLALTDAANHCPVFHEFMILPAMIYDSLVLGTDRFDTNVTHVADQSQTVRDLGAQLDAAVSTRATQTSVDTVDDFLDTEIADIRGRLPAALVSGRMDSNVSAISDDATAADNLEAAFDDTAGAVPWLGVVDQGMAQAATSTTLQLRSAAAFADDALNGMMVAAFGSTQGYWQYRVITDYVGSTDTATVDAWTVTPSGTITYKVFGSAPASSLDNAAIRGAIGLAAANLDTQLDALPTTTELATALGTADDAVLAQVALVKAKTDSLTFTVGGQVDANIQTVNDVGLQGVGTSGNPWRPA